MDTPETLAAALLESAARAATESRAIVRNSAEKINTEAKRNVRASAPIHNAHAQDAITRDTKFTASTLTAEIGYDKDRRGGSLGNLLEYGGGGDHSPPHRDLGRATDNEEPRFITAFDVLSGRLL